MELTPANIRALRTQVFSDFRRAYDETPVFYPRIATTVPSSTKTNTYAWIADMTSMREWLGERTIDNLSSHSYVLENKTWEKTYGINRDDIEDDNLGVYRTHFETFGEAARKHPDELFQTLMQDGENVTCFDGQDFFDTDHPVSSFDSSLGAYSNYSASGLALDPTNFHTVRATMMQYKNDGGRILGIMPNLLIVPPQLEKAAMDIVMAERGANGSTNVLFRMADIMVIPQLGNESGTWYFADTGRRIKPFLFQTRRPLSLQSKDSPSDEVVLHNNELRYYSDARYNAGVTLPFLIYKAAA